MLFSIFFVTLCSYPRGIEPGHRPLNNKPPRGTGQVVRGRRRHTDSLRDGEANVEVRDGKIGGKKPGNNSAEDTTDPETNEKAETEVRLESGKEKSERRRKPRQARASRVRRSWLPRIYTREECYKLREPVNEIEELVDFKGGKFHPFLSFLILCLI